MQTNTNQAVVDVTSVVADARYSEVATDTQIRDIQTIIGRMVSGGFTVAAGGVARPLSNQERFAIASVAYHYGLDPMLGEVFLLGDKPYISTKAMMRVATESGRLARPWSVRPFSKEEVELWGLRDGEIGVVATVWVKGIEHPFEGMGTACAEDVGILRQRGGGVRHDPRIVRKQAINRAVRDVLSMAFGVASADPEDVSSVAGTLMPAAAGVPPAAVAAASAPAPALTGPRPSLGAALLQAQEQAQEQAPAEEPSEEEGAQVSNDLEVVPEESLAAMEVSVVDNEPPPAAYTVRAAAQPQRRIHEATPASQDPRQRMGARPQAELSLNAPQDPRWRR